jgi:hypothetical protein
MILDSSANLLKSSFSASTFTFFSFEVARFCTFPLSFVPSLASNCSIFEQISPKALANMPYGMLYEKQ